MLEAEIAQALRKARGLVAGAVVGHDAIDGDAEACVVGDSGLRKATALSFFSSGRISAKAMREASSMQTWTNSQPAPRTCSGLCGRR